MTGADATEQVGRALAHAGVAAWAQPRIFRVDGVDAAELLSRLSSQDLAPLEQGRAVTTLFLSATGRVLHRVLLQPGPDGLRAVAESAAGPSLAEWVDRYTFAEDCRLQEEPDQAALLLVGPRARELAVAEAGAELAEPAGHASLGASRFSCRSFGPLPSLVVTGPGEELARWSTGWQEAGAVSLDEPALRQLRVEAGVPAAGAELTEDYHPLEAGLRADISFEKGCYTGQEVVARQDTYDKVVRSLVGLVFPEAPAPGTVLESEAKKGCVVSSVAPEAASAGPPGAACLGYVRKRHAADGTPVVTEHGLAGQIVTLPFPSCRGSAKKGSAKKGSDPFSGGKGV